MSDYLSRLAERLTAREPAIVPRARSRFEPDGPEAGAFAEILEEQDAEPLRPALFVRPAASARSPESYEPSAGEAFFDPPLPRPTEVVASASLPTSRHPVRPDRPARDDSDAPPPRLSGSTQEARPTLVEPEPRASRAIGATPRQLAVARARVPGRHGRPDTAMPASQAAVTSPVRSRHVRTAQQVLAPTSSAAEPESDATTVEVSIGRIEIRPPAEPPTQPKPARRAPRLSLESYIEERRGGRR
jgi:hypothetical protein